MKKILLIIICTGTILLFLTNFLHLSTYAVTCDPPKGGNYTVTTNCTFSIPSTNFIKDSSTNGYHGTAVGTTFTTGKYGGARSFNGSSDYIALPIGYGKSSISAITVCAWVKSSSTAKQIIASFDRSEVWRLALVDNTGTLNVGWDTTDSSDTTNDLGTPLNYTDGKWHHICGWYQAGASPDKKIYIDGKVVASTTAHGGKYLGAGAERSTTYGFIGVGSEADTQNGARGPNYWFNGVIDDVRIYNYARTSAQIQEDMNNVPNPTGAPPVAHWTMDDGYVNGVDNGNLTIASGATLTINAGQIIVWNPGKSIIIQDGGSIAINTSGQLTKSYLWVKDVDGDGYADPSDSAPIFASSSPGKVVRRYLAASYSDCDDSNPNITVGSNTYYKDNDGDGYGNPNISITACSQPTGYVTNNTDCYDSNANAHPGSTYCGAVNRGDGSFDYNCDGQQTGCNSFQYVSQVDGWGYVRSSCNYISWVYSPPTAKVSCGATGYSYSKAKFSNSSYNCRHSIYLYTRYKRSSGKRACK